VLSDERDYITDLFLLIVLMFEDWSLKKLFGRMISSMCPLATTSSVYVDVSANEVGSQLVKLILVSVIV